MRRRFIRYAPCLASRPTLRGAYIATAYPYIGGRLRARNMRRRWRATAGQTALYAMPAHSPRLLALKSISRRHLSISQLVIRCTAQQASATTAAVTSHAVIVAFLLEFHISAKVDPDMLHIPPCRRRLRRGRRHRHYDMLVSTSRFAYWPTCRRQRYIHASYRTAGAMSHRAAPLPSPSTYHRTASQPWRGGSSLPHTRWQVYARRVSGRLAEQPRSSISTMPAPSPSFYHLPSGPTPCCHRQAIKMLPPAWHRKYSSRGQARICNVPPLHSSPSHDDFIYIHVCKDMRGKSIDIGQIYKDIRRHLFAMRFHISMVYDTSTTSRRRPPCPLSFTRSRARHVRLFPATGMYHHASYMYHAYPRPHAWPPANAL